jgi:hypothetical protein
MKNLIAALSILTFFAFALVIGCKDQGTNIDSTEIPSSNVSYSQYIQPVFDNKCNNSGCHEDASRAGGLSLTSWANTTSDPGIVFPNEPQNSRLIWAIQNQAGISPMPPYGYVALTKNQIDGIKTWIQEGAKNN